MSATYANSAPAYGTLIYKDDGTGSTPVALMPGSTAMSSVSFVHPGIPVAGTHTVTLRDSSGATVTSNSFLVVAARTITPSAITGTVTGVTYTFAGTLGGYGSAPTLTYRLDGGPALAVTGVTTTAWSMNLTGPAAGSHTIVVSDNNSPPNTGTVSFTTAAPAKVIAVTMPTGVVAGGTIPFMGTLTNYTVAPALTYSFDGNVTRNTLSGVTTTGWSATIPAPATAGSYTVIVSDGTVSGQSTFTVAAAAKTIAITAIPSSVAGTTITFAGTLTGFTAVPTLTYSLDGGGATAVTGETINSWSMTLTAPAAGAHTITATDGTVTSPVSNFTTTAVIKTIVPAQPSGTVQGVAFTFTGTLTGFGSAPTLTYSLDGAAPVSMTGVTASLWSMSITVATGGAHTIVVTDAADNITGSTSFTTAAQTTKTITPNAITGTTQDTAFTFAGSISGYSTIPTLTYTLNSGAPILITGPSLTGWSMTIAVGSSGANTIVVSDGLGNSGVVSFTTTASTRTITPNAPVLPTTGANFTFTGVYTGYTSAPILKYQIDSGSLITMTGIVQNGVVSPPPAGKVNYGVGLIGDNNGISEAMATAAHQTGGIWPAQIVYNNWNTTSWAVWATFFGGDNTAPPYSCLQCSTYPQSLAFNAADLANNHQADFDQLAKNVAALGSNVLSIQLGWEWNNGGVWDKGWDAAGNQTLYIRYWRAMAKSFQQFAPNVIRCWAMNHHYNHFGSPQDFYPGDDVVDAVGLEVYQQFINENASASGPTAALTNDFGWIDNFTKATFKGPNHPGVVDGVTIPVGGKKYMVFAEWANFNDPAYVRDVFAWMQDPLRVDRQLVSLYWNTTAVDVGGNYLISTGNQGGQFFDAAMNNLNYNFRFPIPRLGASTGTGTGGIWSMIITAPAAGAHTITVTDGTVTSGPIPFTVASANAIPILDARVQNPSQKFTDAQGVVWDISLNAQCRANAVVDAITSQVTEMALLPGGNIWQFGTNAWYTETQNNDSWAPGNNPLPPGLPVRVADVMSNWGYQINIDQGTGFSNPTIIAASFAYLNSTLCRQQAKATHSANLSAFATAAPLMRFMLTPMLASSADFNGSGSGGTANNVTTNLNQALTDIGGASRVFSVEGQNQANANQPSGTAATWAAGNTGMANAVRSISALANVPILNLSLSNSSEPAAEAIATAMGNQTGSINWNNWQSFPNDGTGGGSPFSTVVGQLVNNQGVAGPYRAMNWTATGYDQTGNAANGSHVTGAAGGKMLLSGFMTAYAAGVAAVVVYQMFNDAANGFQLFDTAGNPNTMATYIHNLTTVIEDNAAGARTFIPNPLNYTLAFSGTGTQASSLLMQNAAGQYSLILWNNDAVQSGGASPTNVTPNPSNVTITLSVACTSGAVYDPTVGTSPASTFGAVTSIGPVVVRGYPMIVQIVP